MGVEPTSSPFGWSFYVASHASQPCGSGSKFQDATGNLDLAVVVKLVEFVLQIVNLLFQTQYEGVHVGLLQGGYVIPLDGGRVNGRLRAVPGVDAVQELRR